VIDADEVAKMLGISRSAVYDLAAPKGPIRCSRFGRRMIRFNVEDVEAFKQQHMVNPAIPHATTKPPMSTSPLEVSDPLKLNCFQRSARVTKREDQVCLLDTSSTFSRPTK
jgi:excisionase family DNA binding protein